MRKVGVLVFAAVLVMVALTPSAQALSLGAGEVTIHLQDCTTLFTPDPGGSGVLIPREPNWVTPGSLTGFAPDGAAVGDENRTVFNVDSFEYLNQPDVIVPDGELTGLVYDLTLASFIPIGGTSIALNFTGGRVAWYLDTSPEGPDEEHVMNPVPGSPAPLEWVEDAFGPGMDGFTNVNMAPGGGVDPGTLLLMLGDFLPVDASGVTITTIINLATGLGASTGGFIDITYVDGMLLPPIGLGTTPLGAIYDMTFQFTTSQDPDTFYYTSTFADDGLWQISSSDPVRANFVPEPATLSLLGLGVIGLIARRRKRK